jgi:hypothetical protein
MPGGQRLDHTSANAESNFIVTSANSISNMVQNVSRNKINQSGICSYNKYIRQVIINK